MSPEDYESVTAQIIQFSLGDTNKKVTIAITDDELCESPDENFFVSLTLVSGSPPISISTQQAQVVIDDSYEPECCECFHIQLCPFIHAH